MKRSKIVTALLGTALLGLAACSSSYGDGSQPPRNTTIVVPPQSSVTATPGYSSTEQ